jgi:medium-chain acyl-[acyl-carrier-protein] hydrolase
MVDGIFTALAPRIAEVPFALFGHSLGALVAFELARELRRRGAPSPHHLFVSSGLSPSAAQRAGGLDSLDDRKLVERLTAMGGLPEAIAQERELLDAILPTIRADLHALESFCPTKESPLDIPITAIGGFDDVHPRFECLREWHSESTRPLEVCGFAGGHFYLAEHEAELCNLIGSRIRLGGEHDAP